MPFRLIPILLICTLFASSGVSAKECFLWKNEFSVLPSLVIGNIIIITDDVFKPSKIKEQSLFHRTTNKLHITTGKAVLRKQLLFKEGDVFQQDKLAESERLLRKNRYIKDARITPIQLCNKAVTIQVQTQDHWTLTPGFSLGSSGGESRSGLSLQEHNLFGLGKSLALKYNRDSERNSTLLAYKDPQLFGSRKQLSASIQDNSDGKGYALDLSLPFYSTDSQFSWGIKTLSIKQENSFYQQGKIIKKTGIENTHHAVFYGWKTKKPNQRFKVGWSYNKQSYFATPSDQYNAADVTESYPWFELEQYKQRYIKKTNFKTMDRTEDIAIGHSLTTNIGLLSKQLGSNNNYLRLSAKLLHGIEIDNKNLAFVELASTSYLGKGALKGSRVSLKNEWYSFDKRGNDLYLLAQINAANNLLYGEQILLDGDTGLRGYPLGYQTGDKSVFIRAEKRFHFNWYPLHLAKFGAVAFIDAGSAWGKGNKAKSLADAGIGLRIVPTRSSSAKIFHFDLAFPLIDQDKVDKYQIVVKTSYSF